MRKALFLIGLMTMALLLAACETGDSAADPESAQNLQPPLNGFDQEVANDLLENFAAIAGTGSAATGNIPAAAALERINSTLTCLEDVGAVSAVIHRQQNPGAIPQTGVTLIVNQTRVEENILSCVTQLPFSAQSLDSIEICTQTGNFTNAGDSYFYGYIGFGTDFCDQVSTYFSGLES